MACSAMENAVNSLRVVMVGKTGAGKSSLGNALVDKSGLFKVGRGMTSETTDCKWAKVTRDNINIEVTDTPGLCDTHREEKDVYLEVGKSIALAAPGPHVIIMVLRCDKRFTKEEFKAYTALKELFGDKMCDHMFVVFNGLSALQDEDGEKELHELRDELKAELEKGPAELKQVLEDAQHRFFGVSNQLKKSEKQQQSGELIQLLVDLVKKNGNQFYNTDWCKDIAQRVEEIIKNRMEEEHISHEEAEEKTKKDISQGTIFQWFLDIVTGIVESYARMVRGVTDFASSICKTM